MILHIPRPVSLLFKTVSIVVVYHRAAKYSSRSSATARRFNDFLEKLSAMSTSVSPELTAAAFLENPAVALANDIPTEHISLGSEELSLDSDYVQSRKLQKKLVLI